MSIPNYFEQKSEYFTDPTTKTIKEPIMNNTLNITKTTVLSPTLYSLKSASEEVIDAIDRIRYATLGTRDVAPHVKTAYDAADDKEQFLSDAKEALCESLESFDYFRAKIQKKAERTKVQFDVELYVFPSPAVPFKSTDHFITVRFANYMNLKFVEGEPIVQVVFGPAKENNSSWQNHGLPKLYCRLMGLTDPNGKYFAPGYLPVRLLQGLDRGDKFTLTETDDVKVICTVGDKQGVPFDTDFKQLIETNLAGMKD